MSKEIIIKEYIYYSDDAPDEQHNVLVAFLPKDISEAYNEHNLVDSDFGISYIDKQLKPYGYSDVDIFFYFELDEYRKAYANTPHEGDVLIEVEE